MSVLDSARTGVPARRSILTSIVRWLTAAKADRAIVILGFVLLLPSLDTGLAAEAIGFAARQDFVEGLAELAEWVAEQTAEDRVSTARAELEARGLVG